MRSREPATHAEAMAVRIAPIRQDFLTRARTEGIDDLGQVVQRMVAEGGEPCRDVLRRAEPGESLILASYSPFSRPSPYREYGPIFVLADADGEEPPRDGLPPAGEATSYLRDRFVVRAYSKEEEIRDARLIRAPAFHETVEELLASPETAFLHVRFPTYGCFACRIDRSRD